MDKLDSSRNQKTLTKPHEIGKQVEKNATHLYKELDDPKECGKFY